MTGPASIGAGQWPHMTFESVDDPFVRAACEFVQEVVATIEERLAPRDEVQRHEGTTRRELARRSGIGHDSLNDILLGRVWPRSDRLARIAAAASITLGVL